MTVAQVIVDVQAKQTDRPYDYRIPVHLQEVIKQGMRVIVPFGPRKVQGFVIGIVADSQFAKLRNIIEPMDIEPVLNEELLNLSDWLTEQTLCYKISAFQVMLPPALKAKYEKKIRLKDRAKLNVLPEGIQDFFRDKDLLKWEEVLETGHLSQFQKEVSSGILEVLYEVKERIKKKQTKQISPLISIDELRAIKESLNRSIKQKKVIDYFIDHPEPIERSKLLTELGVSSAVIKGLMEKGILSETKKEVYRDPYANR